MSIYDLYEIDPVLEIEGKWITTISKPEEFLLAYMNNPEAEQETARLLSARRDDIQKYGTPGAKVPDELNQFIIDVNLKVFCGKVLRGWKHVSDRNGKKIPFTPENAYKMLSDPRMRKLRDALYVEASKLSHFNAQKKEKTEKNSRKASAGA